MKASVYHYPGRAHEPYLRAVIDGLQRHGLRVDTFNSLPSQDSDFVVTWGWRVAERVKEYFSGPVLVAERGYIDRENFTSLGWDGLNGRARFPPVADPDRFSTLFGGRLQPWRSGSAGYALVIGQVVGDAQISGIDIHAWYRKTCISLYKAGWEIIFRPHPVETKRGNKPPPVPFAEVRAGGLAEALAGAGLVVCYNSNTAVDAILAGIPVHVEDRGSMVYDLASHDFGIFKPDRGARLNEIANLQWSTVELAGGEAWDAVKLAMNP